MSSENVLQPCEKVSDVPDNTKRPRKKVSDIPGNILRSREKVSRVFIKILLLLAGKKKGR
ncbi:hypothetical protein DMA11_08140 [Marinilabiliaceae bacterium JC017]|nr:hypothetical protein DMA11_08140 [Marinilabiliaceae bacterium JC017]